MCLCFPLIAINSAIHLRLPILRPRKKKQPAETAFVCLRDPQMSNPVPMDSAQGDFSPITRALLNPGPFEPTPPATPLGVPGIPLIDPALAPHIIRPISVRPGVTLVGTLTGGPVHPVSGFGSAAGIGGQAASVTATPGANINTTQAFSISVDDHSMDKIEFATSSIPIKVKAVVKNNEATASLEAELVHPEANVDYFVGKTPKKVRLASSSNNNSGN